MSDAPADLRRDLQAAISHHQAGQLAEAERLYGEILARAPQHPDALHFLGLLAQQTGDSARAVTLISAALKLIPRHPHCHLHLGLALQSLGRVAEALSSYEQAIALDPALPEAHNNVGYLRLELGEHDRAMALLERALALRPDFPEALNNRGMALEALGQPEAALADLARALALRPDYPEAFLNQGNALQALGRLAEARQSYARALELRPGHADAHNNLGQALEALGRMDEALTEYRRAQALRPDFATAHWNESLALLRRGDFAEGWRLYEWRWKAVGRHRLVRDFVEPRWSGSETLAGRTIFLHYEQGLGDTLQMLRYVPVLAARGARVLVEVPRSMAELAATLPGAATVVVEGSPVPAFELQCPLMSLPLACGTTLASIPATVPYLHAPDAARTAWRDRLGPKARRRIGLAWSGSAGHTSAMRQRGLPLERLRRLLDLDAEFHSLHIEYREGDRALLATDGRIRDHAAALRSFADTAALIDQLDLVITVDTAVAHLAGALGKAVWLLLPLVCDYRWMLQRTDSPWYPTMRLFRQPAFGDWDAILGAVSAALRAEVSGE